MAEAAESKQRDARQLIYAILAAVLCFVGPTYLVAAVSRVITLNYAIIPGFVSFLVGVIVIFRLVKE